MYNKFELRPSCSSIRERWVILGGAQLISWFTDTSSVPDKPSDLLKQNAGTTSEPCWFAGTPYSSSVGVFQLDLVHGCMCNKGMCHRCTYYCCGLCIYFWQPQMTHVGTPTVVVEHATMWLECVTVMKDVRGATASTGREVRDPPMLHTHCTNSH